MEKKTLVAYFSASGTTARVAKNLAEAAEADLFEIQPVIAYTDADLDWMNKNSRSSLEKNDPSFRPEVANTVENMEQYDTVFVGFPIWWYVAPNIIHTFLESYDFSGKNIVLFATSGGSGFGRTLATLQTSVAKDAKMIEGRVLSSRTSVAALSKWVHGLHL